MASRILVKNLGKGVLQECVEAVATPKETLARMEVTRLYLLEVVELRDEATSLQGVEVAGVAVEAVPFPVGHNLEVLAVMLVDPEAQVQKVLDSKAVLIHGTTRVISKAAAETVAGGVAIRPPVVAAPPPVLNVARPPQVKVGLHEEVLVEEHAVEVEAVVILIKTPLIMLEIGVMIFPRPTTGTMKSTLDLWLTPRYSQPLEGRCPSKNLRGLAALLPAEVVVLPPH